MMSLISQSDEDLLVFNGWHVECASPFEIRHEDGSFATKQAADLILSSLKEESVVMKFRELALGARFSYLGKLNKPFSHQRVWIKISNEGFGQIVEYDPDSIKSKNWIGQQHCSFASSKEELETTDVVLLEP